jgi:hypothetical protein
VFDRFPEIVHPLVGQKILKKAFKLKTEGLDASMLFKADGVTLRDPTSVWVDDSIVIAAMRQCWDIPAAGPFESNRYGISSHMWQSLALASYFVAKSNGWKPTTKVKNFVRKSKPMTDADVICPPMTVQ